MGSTTKLALTAHGTNGADGIEEGIHLRWQFSREMGFPLDGFKLYRRLSGQYGTYGCFDFGSITTKLFAEPFSIGVPAYSLNIDSSVWPLKVEGPLKVIIDEATLVVKPVQKPLTTTSLPLTPVPTTSAPPTTGTTSTVAQSFAGKFLMLGSASVKIKFPSPVYSARLSIVFRSAGLVTVIAYSGDIEVKQISLSGALNLDTEMEIQASNITSVILTGNVALRKICSISQESCDGTGWEQIGGTFCLPVTYPSSPCVSPYSSPDCDWLRIASKFPQDPCAQLKYGGATAKELSSVLSQLVNSALKIPQSDRFIDGTAVSADCVNDIQPPPAMNISALDMVLIAALDPVIARVVGLYYIDKNVQASTRYDYKVIGSWPRSTLWQLKNRQTFDYLQAGFRFPMNVFSIGNLQFKSYTRPTVDDRESHSAKTLRALHFSTVDDNDWNFPSFTNAPLVKPSTSTTEIRFQQPVGEVQLYLGQSGGNVVLDAYNAQGVKVITTVSTSLREDTVAIHGDNPGDLIASIVITGENYWIYKLCWGGERIAFGTYCAFVYGVEKIAATRLPAPENIHADVLPGIVRKKADCDPPMTGEVIDARFSAGVSWKLPFQGVALLPKSAIRYRIKRSRSDGEIKEITGASPMLVSRITDEVRQRWKSTLPEGWPQEPPFKIDSGLEAMTYNYSVSGIDIFGRESDYSAQSNSITAFSPLPFPPTNLVASFLDRDDRWLNEEDKKALPEGINEAIRLRWQWLEEYHRNCPDVKSFHVYFNSGIPNVLTGQFSKVTGELNGVLSCEVIIENRSALTAAKLSGRILTQGGKSFRILSHGAGALVAGTSNIKVTMNLQAPPAPSTNRPIAGECTIPPDATIPVKVKDITINNNSITLKISTGALREAPGSGFVNGKIYISDKAWTIEQASGVTQSGNELEAQLSFTTSGLLASVDNLHFTLLRLQLPLFVKMDLPSLDASLQKDYSVPASWSSDLKSNIPKTTNGEYTLVIRTAVAGETPGVFCIGDRRYIKIISTMPATLAVDSNHLTTQFYFGISSENPKGEGKIVQSLPAMRVYRKPPENKPLDPVLNIYASDPNFAGKSSFIFTFPRTEKMQYEVFRTLDETLLKIDAQIRGLKNANGAFIRSRLSADYSSFLSTFASQYVNEIKARIIEPAEINLSELETLSYKNILLQALASLPFNDRAFTRLELDTNRLKQNPADATKMQCTDDTLEGNSAARYFYRVRTIDAIGNASELGTSTVPVYVKGIIRPLAPVVTRILGGDRKITLSCYSNRETDLKEYRIFRTDALQKAQDIRLMALVQTIPIPEGDPLLRPAEITIDDPVEATIDYYYRFIVVTNAGRLSEPSSFVIGRAYSDYAPDPPVWGVPQVDTNASDLSISWTSEVTDLMCLVERRIEGSVEWQNLSGWLERGTYLYVDKDRIIGTTYEYKLRVLDVNGCMNKQFLFLTA